MSRMPTPNFTVRFRKLSANGHDEWTKKFSEIETDFNELMKSGYAMFVGETQVRELAEVESLWAELGSPEDLPVYAVPALRGGKA